MGTNFSSQPVILQAGNIIPQPKLPSNGLTKRNRKKIIRKIIKKRTQDGSFIPVEVTKVVIGRDGSKSITREDPSKYYSKRGSLESMQSDFNVSYQNQ